MLTFSPVSLASYSDAWELAASHDPRLWDDTDYPDEFKHRDCRFFLSYDRKTGFGVRDVGEIVCVFNVGQKGNGAEAVREAIARGGWWLTCFAGALVGYYKKLGFEIGRVEDNLDADDERDVYYMVLG